MIKPTSIEDFEKIYQIIYATAQVYRGIIPSDCWKEPYMERSSLKSEIDAGVQFWGWYENGEPIGIMGIQKVLDATLIRHAYTQPAHQGKGIGGKLLNKLSGHAEKHLLVGTWAAASWAIRFYERHGFRMVSEQEKDMLLKKYWTISDRQRETSVVLVKT
jgi:GNAT superfamily N-acetyltransferase